MKNNLSTNIKDIKKCLNVLLFGILNSENMFDSCLLEKHESFGKTTACGREAEEITERSRNRSLAIFFGFGAEQELNFLYTCRSRI